MKDIHITLRVTKKMHQNILKISKETNISFSELLRLYIQAGINSYGKTY